MKLKKNSYTNKLNQEQLEAFSLLDEFVEKGKGMFLLKGFAGSGKTYVISRFIEYFTSKDLINHVALTAPTNKAVSVLKESTKKECPADFLTIHKLLGLKRQITYDGEEIFVQNSIGACEIESYDVVVIDEVSMLNDDLFHKIKKFSKKVKIIFMGDPAQIPPVNKNDCIPFENPKKYNIKEFTLSQIMRQKEGSDIIGTSFYIRENLNKSILKLKLSGNKDVRLLNPNIPSHKEKAVDLFQRLVKKDGFQTSKVIAWRNKTVAHYNKYIRGMLYNNEMNKVMEGERMIFNSPLIEDRSVLVNNSQEVVVKDVSTAITSFGKRDIQHYICNIEWYDIDEEGYVSLDINIVHENSEVEWNDFLEEKKKKALNEENKNARRQLWAIYYKHKESFADIDYAYAITAHKSQGSTYEEVVLAMDDITSNPKKVERNRILYTAISRASKQLTVLNRFNQ